MNVNTIGSVKSAQKNLGELVYRILQKPLCAIGNLLFLSHINSLNLFSFELITSSALIIQFFRFYGLKTNLIAQRSVQLNNLA